MKINGGLIFVITLVFLAGCVSQEEKPEAVPTTLEATVPKETTVPETVPATTTIAKVSENLKIGEIAKISVLEVEVEGFQKISSLKYYDTKNNQYYRLKAPADKTFGIASARVRNLEKIGTFSPDLNISRFSIIDSDGNSYAPERLEGADLMPLLKTLNSGNEMEGRVVFKIPGDAEGLVLSYDFTGLEAGAGKETWDLE